MSSMKGIPVYRGSSLVRFHWVCVFKTTYLPISGETPWFDLPLIKDVVGYCKQCFPMVEYALGNTPTYVGGSMGYLLCGTNPVSIDN